MFQVGDYVIYANNGVCRVDNIGTLAFDTFTKGRIYYTLIPVYGSGGRLFVPVDSNKVFIRYALTKEQTMELLEDLSNIEPLWIMNEKGRELEYKNAINSCDCRRIIQIIKTLYVRKKERMNDGKKVTAVDDRYFNMAEDKLYGEMALALEIDKDKAGDYIKIFMERNKS